MIENTPFDILSRLGGSQQHHVKKPTIDQRARGVRAILGPTNTGKTFLAIERMVAYGSGMIGLPLRLLAREVYERVVEKVGVENVALITGEEKIKPKRPRYWVATVEAMPKDVSPAFLAIDEVQLATDIDRGHIFTDRILNARGTDATLLLGASTMRPLLERLIPNIEIITRPRLSTLTFAGETKITRLPPRSAIVAFSTEEVYAIAELIRRQRGGAAVVMGALSPRTRNAQVALYQSGEVDYIVATDAIGMGLNLDVRHVAFAACQKFDGRRQRLLTAAELGQIAGRAGRHMNDGTFGTTGRCPAFDEELVARLENHDFAPVTGIQWRSTNLDMSSWSSLKASLAQQPDEMGLMQSPEGDDERCLDMMERDVFIHEHVRTRKHLELVWQIARIPDYRKLSVQAHNELIVQIARYLLSERFLPEEWLARQIGLLDRTDGDIDALATRIAHMRTWAYVAHQSDWLEQPEYWQGVTRQLEERMSDVLHERLTQRFVDRRTGLLMRRLKENAMIEADVTANGDVQVEGQSIGTLLGFQFAPDPTAEGNDAKALKATAARVLISALEAKSERLYHTPDQGIMLTNDGMIRWEGHAVGRLVAGESLLKPRIMVMADDYLLADAKARVESRLNAFVAAQVQMRLGPLAILEASEGINGMARGIAYQIVQVMGVLDRATVAEEVKGLDQDSRAALRTLGVRFGAHHLYMPLLLKPKPRQLAVHLWLLKNEQNDTSGVEEMAHLAESGRTSFPANPAFSADLYRVAGYRLCGSRVVRVDILERLADLIRPAVMYRPGLSAGTPPEGTADYDGFIVTGTMTSLAGCAGDDFAEILRSLGYVLDRRKGPAITKAIKNSSPIEPIKIAPIVVEENGAHVTSEQAHTDDNVQDVKEAEVSEAINNDVSLETPVEETAIEEPTVQEQASLEAITPTTEAPVAELQIITQEPVEPDLIDVWRPKRQGNTHHQGEKRERSAPREGQKPHFKSRYKPQTAAPHVNPQEGDTQRASQGEAVKDGYRGKNAPRTKQDGEAQRDDKPRFKPNPKPWSGEKNGAPKGERTDQRKSKDERKNSDKRDERPRLNSTAFKGDTSFDSASRDERQGNVRLLATTEAPRKGKEPDPLSPFAKLMALKGEMQEKK